MKRLALLIILLAVVAIVGCERRIDVEPSHATKESYRDQIDFDQMPTATREIYDRILDGSLAGANASDFQELLDTAQQIRDQKLATIYIFQLTGFDQSFEEVNEEYVPFMYVCVQKKFGHIYRCDLADPEW